MTKSYCTIEMMYIRYTCHMHKNILYYFIQCYIYIGITYYNNNILYNYNKNLI